MLTTDRDNQYWIVGLMAMNGGKFMPGPPTDPRTNRAWSSRVANNIRAKEAKWPHINWR